MTTSGDLDPRDGAISGRAADRVIDPVAEPSAYQRMLLELLGDDDPAEVQALTPGVLRELVQDARDALRIRP